MVDSLKYRNLLAERQHKISTLLENVEGSLEYSASEKGRFSQDIKPILSEILTYIERLRKNSLDGLLHSDVENLYSIFSSRMFDDMLSSATSYVKNLSRKEGQVNVLEIEDLYHRFLYEPQPTYSENWKLSLLDLLGKQNLSDANTILKAADLLSSYEDKHNEAQEVLYNANKQSEAVLLKSEQLFKKTEGLFGAKSAEMYVERFKEEARGNLKYLVVTLFAILCFFCFEYHYVFFPLQSLYFVVGDMSDHQFYLLLLKSFFFALFSLAVFAALLKVCAIFLHNYLVNNEKAAALFAFDKFFKDNQNPIAIPAATLELTKTVIGTRDTGLFNKQGSGNFGIQEELQLFNKLLSLIKNDARK